MPYPKFSPVDQVTAGADRGNVLSEVVTTLATLPFNMVSPALAAGSTGATTLAPLMIVPTHAKLLSAKALITAVNTGTGNTPTVELYAGATKIGESVPVELGGAIGDIIPIVLTETLLQPNAVLTLKVVNPSGTITTPLTVKAQIEWCSYQNE